MTPADVPKLIKEKDAKFADLRFTDTIGKEQHVTVPTRLVDEGFFKDGKMFDGSSIAGWKGINESDMILMPDPATAVIDPFYEETTVNLRCDVIEPMTMQGYERDPRSLAKRAEAYLKSSGIADSALFGSENEFFIFDDVTVSSGMNGYSYEVDAYEGASRIFAPQPTRVAVPRLPKSSQASIGSSIHCGRISPDKCACLPPTAQSSPPARHFG